MPRVAYFLLPKRPAGMACLAMVLLLWGTTMAGAGAWPRSKGHLFVATAHYANPGGGYSGLYLDFGLTPRLGLGLDWGRSVSGKQKSVVFLRRPVLVDRLPGNLAVAAELGLGVIDQRWVLRPGLSLGRGVTVGGRSGWVSGDVLAELDRDGGLDLKADLTLGVTFSPRLTGMVQMQMGQPRHDPQFVRVVPSVLWRLRGGAQVEFGLTQEVQGGGATGIKIGLWREF